MKQQLTAEQSVELFKRVVSPYKASAIEEYNDAVSKWTCRGRPIFTFENLLEVLLISEIYEFALWVQERFYLNKE